VQRSKNRRDVVMTTRPDDLLHSGGVSDQFLSLYRKRTAFCDSIRACISCTNISVENRKI